MRSDTAGVTERRVMADIGLGGMLLGGGLLKGLDFGLSSWANSLNMSRQHGYDMNVAAANYKATKALMAQQNAWSSPSNQMRLFEKAGLNPNLVYGHQIPSASPSGNIVQNNARSNINPGSASDGLMQYLSMKNVAETNKNLQSLTGLHDAQILKTMAEIEEIDARTTGMDINNLTDYLRGHMYRLTGSVDGSSLQSLLAGPIRMAMASAVGSFEDRGKDRSHEIRRLRDSFSRRSKSEPKGRVIQVDGKRPNWLSRRFYDLSEFFDRF
ncbi:DNA pilot protein [Tortoise microvirus 34]|nr:DNA pilot protein [Tortoise microvirus 34]